MTLRVHVLKYASPGIYPVLKASEVLENRRCNRNLCRDPNCRGSGDCIVVLNDGTCLRSSRTYKEERHRILSRGIGNGRDG